MVVKVGGLSDEGVHHARIDLCGGGVIDKGDGCAGVVGDGLAGAGLHVLADFRAAVGVAEHVDVAVVEAGEDDDLGFHHRGDEAEQFGLEAGAFVCYMMRYFLPSLFMPYDFSLC